MDVSSTSGVPQPGRRVLLKGSAVAGGLGAAYGLFRPNPGAAQTTTIPYLAPFVDPLPIARVKTPSVLTPAPGERAVPGEAGRDPHQRWAEFLPKLTYELRVKAFRHKYHAHLPEETCWGYDGQIPGPTFVVNAGSPIVVRVHNELPPDHIGYGTPEISTHLHSGHVGPASDGFADSWYSRTKCGSSLAYPGAFFDHHFPNFPPGQNPNATTNTLWYHDHREDYTAPNVYRGLAGFYIAFDPLDTGNEMTGLRLPSGVGKYDIPLLLQDKKFDSSGRIVYGQFDQEGFLGNHFLVNGKVQPYFKVEARKYRFRMLNASMARYFEMWIADESNSYKDFHFIASDGNLLERPLKLKKILLGMAERADIIVDFSSYPPGTKLYLVNRMAQDDPRKPDDDRLSPGIRMLRFDVVARTAPDNSVIPAFLRPLPPIDRSRVARRRLFEFGRKNGQWTINDRFFNPDRVDAAPRLGVPEIWRFETSGGWAHPVHVHLDDFRILSIDGKAPPPEWRGRKDTVSMLQGQEIEILIEFRDFTGKYMMHCHHHMHEDHAMMIRFDVVP
ncbi:multicopper oxidase family protein [Massilia sp. CMS3.1]|uniref:multicopper oxidase family protein n=1 Tax=Massilia sp. CMS3.1 TaxID=3373083 RepID=UPI003EE7E61D